MHNNSIHCLLCVEVRIFRGPTS